MTGTAQDGVPNRYPRRSYGVYAGLVVMAVCWGGAFVAGRVATAEIAPAMAALLRFVVALVALLLVALVVEKGLPRIAPR